MKSDAIPDRTPKPLENGRQARKPLVSVVVPGYNEAAIVERNLRQICEYMETLESRYRWELIFVNDGSTDATGDLAEAFAAARENVYILHHFTNFRLGQALRYAFGNCRGDYVVTLDVDLSYSPDHVGQLLEKIAATRAKIVIASPYMSGGKVSHVPWFRKTLSRWANRYLCFSAPGELSTLTGMVRAYDAKFLKSLNLKALDSEINEEIIFKAQMLGARILEIPAHLDWSLQKRAGAGRQSSMKVLKKISATIFSGFMFRPFLVFVLPGAALFLLSIYPLAWASIHTMSHYGSFSTACPALAFSSLFSAAAAQAMNQSTHSFLVWGFGLLFSLQLVSLGILAVQIKRYFEEVFQLVTSIYRNDMGIEEE
ncbi:glycosyltransferase family 2 protein, partial [bacterium]|nr:glycosyltransferase family 2 protein [bacterium]